MSFPRLIKRIAIFISALLLLALIIMLFWLFDEYEADEIAVNIYNNSDNIIVSDGVIGIHPLEESDTSIIFYPGAKVEAIAYLPLLSSISEQCNVTCYLVEMPLNYAIFDSKVAADIIADNPDTENWYMSGHSLGGVMACDFSSDNAELIEGVIVMGAAMYGSYPTAQSLTIYGTLNNEIADAIDYTDNIVVIDGGNHAQFGNYGKQDGDRDATITSEDQQQQTVDAINKFIE